MRDTNRGRATPSPIRLLIPYSSLLPSPVDSLRTFGTPLLFIPRSGNVPRQESRYIGREAPLTSKSFISQFRSVSRYEAVFKPSLACQFCCKHVEEGWPDEAASPSQPNPLPLSEARFVQEVPALILPLHQLFRILIHLIPDLLASHTVRSKEVVRSSFAKNFSPS